MAILGIVASSNAFGRSIDHRKGEIDREREKISIERQTNKLWDSSNGWILSSSGGLSYINPNDDRHWFKLSGVIRLDETFFMGSYSDKAPVYTVPASGSVSFPSSANLRRVQAYFDGGVGENWEYTLTLTLTGNYVNFGDTWLSYTGLLANNNEIFVGNVAGNWFGLENANSTSWNPFLESSLASNAFYPGDGLGVMTDFWGDLGGITLVAMQPVQKPGNNGSQSVLNNNGSEVIPGVNDRWHGTVRATIAPMHEAGNVCHFGVSGAFRELNSTIQGAPTAGFNKKDPTASPGVAFVVGPDARGRNTTDLLNTTTGNLAYGAAGGAPIRANNVRLFNVEAARQIGPWMLEGEYTNAYVHRIGSTLGSVQFAGWNVQTRYLLTGEHHEYDVRDGNFGSVNINNPYGAVELAARYDYVNLNDKDVRGGSEHNVTVGLNWFVNQQVRLSANYIRASIHPALDKPRRDLDIIGMRCQIRFK